jgi:hypothetical protein
MAVAHDRASGQRSAAWPQPNLSGESEFDVGALAAGEAGFGVRSQQLPLSARTAALTRSHFGSKMVPGTCEKIADCRGIDINY